MLFIVMMYREYRESSEWAPVVWNSLSGSVMKEYPSQRSVRKGISNPVLPDNEDSVSTKDVRHLFSVMCVVFFGGGWEVGV